MSLKAPKNGLAATLRAWMSAREAPFSAADLCEGLGIAPGAEHQRIRNALDDFFHRGEILRCPRVKRNRRQVPWKYRYNPAWKAAMKGTLQGRILKSMYVSGTFAVTDIRRLAQEGEKALDRSWIEKVVRRLVAKGYLQAVGRRVCGHGAGAETLYHVVNRDRFRLEVMR
jgi:hypothetical protein